MNKSYEYTFFVFLKEICDLEAWAIYEAFFPKYVPVAKTYAQTDHVHGLIVQFLLLELLHK